jgi:predicted outer membrane repeat protein
MHLRFTSLLLIYLLVMLFSAVSVQAAGVVGSGTPESCTEIALDEALAQTMATGGTLTFDCGAAPHIITVTSPKYITDTITIDGGNLITLSGGGKTTVIELDNNLPLLTLQNLTIADGYAERDPLIPNDVCKGGACGGGVRGRYAASLTVINCVFINNHADDTGPIVSQNSLDYGGGAIYLHTGVLTVSNSQFIDNVATNSAGGGIHVLHSNATVSFTLFEGNQADYYGGAFFSDGTIDDGSGITTPGRLIFINNEFRDNSGRGQGGAVFNYLYQNRNPNVLADYNTNRFIGNSVTADIDNHAYGGALRAGNGPIRISNTTFSGNTAASQGGALWTGELGTLTIWNSTFFGFGGALRLGSKGRISLNNLTIANNHAGQFGGAMYGAGGNVSLMNSIIANNTSTNPWGMSENCRVTYGGTNNIQTAPLGPKDNRCARGVIIGDPMLGALSDQVGAYGQLMPLLTGSPAIDGGNNAVCPEVDPRGRFRSFDGNGDGVQQCDMGAYEYTQFDNVSSVNAPPSRNAFVIDTATLAWSGLEWATAYQIEVDNNSNFGSVNYVLESPSSDLSLQIGPLQGGIYHWRVRGKRPDGTWGNWSAPESFLVRVP